MALTLRKEGTEKTSPPLPPCPLACSCHLPLPGSATCAHTPLSQHVQTVLFSEVTSLTEACVCVCVCECTEPCVYACCIAQQSPAGVLAFWDRTVQCVSRALFWTLYPLLCTANAAVSRPLIFCSSVQPLPQRGQWARKHERWISVDNESQNRMCRLDLKA